MLLKREIEVTDAFEASMDVDSGPGGGRFRHWTDWHQCQGRASRGPGRVVGDSDSGKTWA